MAERKLELNDLPSNSKTRNTAAEKEANDKDIQEKHVERAATGKTHTRRESFGRKFMKTFFEGNFQDTKKYLVEDVVKPAIKENLADAINAAVGMMLFNEVRRGAGSRRGSNSNGSRVSYGGYFNGGSGCNGRREKMPSYQNSSDSPSRVAELMKETRGEAEDVLDILQEVLENYDQVTVADYYDAFGYTSDDFQDNKFGWKNLDGVMVKRVRGGIYDDESRRWVDGFMLTMPREIALTR